MALVPLVAEEDATRIVKEVFDDIKSSRNLAKVPNFWRAIVSGLKVEYEPPVPAGDAP